MEKGIYVRKNTNKRTVTNSAQPRAEGQQKKIQRPQITLIIAALLVVLILAVTLLKVDVLAGRWNMDDVTAYHFDGKGKGALVLPHAQYVFSYTIEEDVLCIDFDHEGAKDAEYTFHVEGDTLTLNGGNATTKGEFVLTKEGK